MEGQLFYAGAHSWLKCLEGRFGSFFTMKTGLHNITLGTEYDVKSKLVNGLYLFAPPHFNSFHEYF